MSLLSRIQDDVKTAMKAGAKEKLGTLRMAVSELKRAAIDSRAELTDEQEVAILQRMLKQRRESIDAFTKGNRPDLVATEQAEIEVLAAYMPAQLTDEELAAAVREVIAQTGATSARDLGKVMGPLLKRHAGRLDGNRARAAVQAALGA
jgi:uncharacterized protein YqeY